MNQTALPLSYVAVFSTGDRKELKRSVRQYSAAYLAIVAMPDGQKRKYMGFSRTRELAGNAISSETAYVTGNSKGRFARAYPMKNPGVLEHSEVIDIKARGVS